MNGSAAPQPPNFRLLRIIAWIMLGVMPLFYLALSYFVRVYPTVGDAEKSLVTNILLIVAVVALALLPLVERIQISAYRAQKNPKMTPAQLFFTLSMIKIASVEAVYILGLVVYLVTGEPMRMYYFYPVGIAWSLVYWPRPSSFDALIAKLEKK